MTNKALTLTVVANMTSNYGEGLGNISSLQKVYKNGKAYSIRTRESLKNAIMVQSGMYDDLQTSVSGATQKQVTEELDATNCKALEGGYMNTTGITNIRKSSFYLTDAISCDEFINETRFQNNLYLATNYANANNLNVQTDAGKIGLMPYQYEYEKSMKVYSITIDLEAVGMDQNFGNSEASNEEKANRVNAIVDAVSSLSLVVKGNLDNAEPLFVAGGLTNRKTHYFENVVKVANKSLVLSDELTSRVAAPCSCAILTGDNFANELLIKESLNPLSIKEFFDNIKLAVNDYYGV